MNDPNRPVNLTTVEECVDAAIVAIGKRIVMGAPLGLGKPNQLVNAFYRRAIDDPSIHLTIFTALSLEIPKPGSDVEARLLEPFFERHFGSYVELEYMRDLRAGGLPDNITLHEFYFRAGSMRGVASAQRDYVSTNYTHVARDLVDRGVNVLVQLVAEKEVDGQLMLSLSSNADVTLDVVAMLETAGRSFVSIAQVHPDMPFMYNRAMVEPGAFDFVVRNPRYDTTLFAMPNMAVKAADFAIGLHASSLIKDGGTLQIGVGSLGDAITYFCQLRQNDNLAYRRVANELGIEGPVVDAIGGLAPFETGLYGCSEMFVNGFLHLRRDGILKREVFEDVTLQRLLDDGIITQTVDRETLDALLRARIVGPVISEKDVIQLRHWGVFKQNVELEGDRLRCGSETIGADLGQRVDFERCCEVALGNQLCGGIFMHGAFFLGPTDFYQGLRSMARAEAEKIGMDSVRRINRIDDPVLQTMQRRHARFINTAMMVTLSGAAVSDGLQNGQVVSGVGGQYNFVAQAHELPGGRSIICVRSTRGSRSEIKSNLVWNYGHITIPRHLRDIVVTEYGVADLRGKTDQEIIQALLNIADSRFQEELLATAVNAAKIRPDYRIPERYRNNTPQRVQAVVEDGRSRGLFPAFPLGTDLTDEEIALAKSLRDIKDLMEEPRQLVRAVLRSFIHGVDEEQAAPYLERIGLEHPDTPRDMILRHLLLLELEEEGYLRPL